MWCMEVVCEQGQPMPAPAFRAHCPQKRRHIRLRDAWDSTESKSGAPDAKGRM